MPLSFVGSVTVGAVLPLAVEGNAIALAQVEGQLAGLRNVSVALTISPPSVAANAEAAAKAAAQAAATIEGPTATLQATALLGLIAELQASALALAQLNVALGTPGLYAWTYEGPTGDFGTQLRADLDSRFPTTQPCAAVVFLATTPAVAAALSAVAGANLTIG